VLSTNVLVLSIVSLDSGFSKSSFTTLEEVWGAYYDEKIASLKTIIKQLRKKLPPETIQNIYGQGYRVKI